LLIMSGKKLSTPQRVIGIQFTEESLVPIVMLKASGEQAERVVAQANQVNQKPVVSSSPLAQHLYRIPMGDAVTPDLFPLMAALLAHVIQVDKNLQDKLQGRT
jgi:type III secretory pathway component EscU